MSNTKEMSKRQMRREQIRRKEMRSRIFSISIISIGAILLVLLFVWPYLKPVGAITEPEVISRPDVKFNAAGNPDAPIKIEEYADFQCPFCRRFFEDTEANLMETYVADGTVYFVYHSFGDFIGAESGRAAEAAYCAGDQEKFWEMHDVIYANQTGENVGAFTDRRLQAFANHIELDMSKFNSCFGDDEHKDLVEQDAKDALANDIQATPSFIMSYIVNGETKTKFLEGAQPYDVFKQEIDAALAEMAAQ